MNDIWPTRDEREFHHESEIPKELFEEIRNSFSDDEWNLFVEKENYFIQRDQLIDIKTNPFTLIDQGWGLFTVIN